MIGRRIFLEFEMSAIDDAMATLHSAINDSLNQMHNRIQESACWTVDELNHETQRTIQEGGPNFTLAQIFEAGACFAAERILASVIPQSTQSTEGTAAPETSPRMVGG